MVTEGHEVQVQSRYNFGAKTAEDELVKRIEVIPETVTWFCKTHGTEGVIDNESIALCFVFADIGRIFDFELPPDAKQSYDYCCAELSRVVNIVCSNKAEGV